MPAVKQDRTFFGQPVWVGNPGDPITSAEGYFLGIIKPRQVFTTNAGIWTTADVYLDMTRAYDNAGAAIVSPLPPEDPVALIDQAVDLLIDLAVDIASNAKPVREADPGDFRIAMADLNRLGRILTTLNKLGKVKI